MKNIRRFIVNSRRASEWWCMHSTQENVAVIKDAKEEKENETKRINKK